MRSFYRENRLLIMAVAAILCLLLAACSEKEESTAAEADIAELTSTASETAADMNEQIHQAILDFCEMMYGSMKSDSTVTFGWDDFDSIEGYMIAKYCEANRDFYKIDHHEITDVRVLSVDLQGEPMVSEGSCIQCAVVSYEYDFGEHTAACSTRYFFTLREENGLRVTDLTTYNEKYSITESDDAAIAGLRDSLDLWKDICKDAGDKWQFEAVDRIMEQKKVPIDDLIPEEMKEEMKRRSMQTSDNAEAVDIRANESYELPSEEMNSGMTFTDGDIEYRVSYTYLDCYDVYFSDNSIKTVGEALEMGLIGLSDLERFQVPYKAETAGKPSGSETQAPAETSRERETQKETAETTRGRETEAAATKAKETEKESRKSGSSRYYTDEDIDRAKEAVRDWMKESFESGYRLKELYYPGDDFTDEFADSGYNAFKDTDSSMVLGGYWIQSDGVERGSSGYPLWFWILGRSSDGGWYVKDAGY